MLLLLRLLLLLQHQPKLLLLIEQRLHHNRMRLRLILDFLCMLRHFGCSLLPQLQLLHLQPSNSS